MSVSVDFLSQFIAEQLREPEPDPAPVPAPPDGYTSGVHRRLLRLDTAPAFAREELLTVSEARAYNDLVIHDYAAEPFPTSMLLVKATPGLGKTTIAVQVAEEMALAGRRVMYCGPRHNFWSDLMAKAEHPRLWYEWLPRQAAGPDQPDKVETCPHCEHINEWMRRGNEAIDFCSAICGWDVIKGECRYHRQKDRTEPIIFAQHLHAVHGLPLSFDVVIGDESPLGAFQHEWNIPAEFVQPKGMDVSEPITAIMHTLSLLSRGEEWIRGRELLGELGGPALVRQTCDTAVIPLDAAWLNPEIHQPRDAAKAEFTHLRALVPLLLRESRMAEANEPYIPRVYVGHKRLRLLLRHPPFEKLPPHIIWLDATANERLYQACFRRPVQLADVQTALQGRIFQLYERANHKTALVANDKLTDDAARKQGATDHQRSDDVACLVKRIIDDYRYQNPMIISFQALLDKHSDLKALRHLHFYAARGTNLFEDADAAFIIGTPQPSLYELEKLAAMLFLERDKAFAAEWTTANRPYRFVSQTGAGYAYPVSGFWGDPDLQAVLWSVREAEIIQAAHRCRPVNKAVDIWLLSNLPIDELPPTKLLSVRDVLSAPQGVNPFEWDKIVQVAGQIAADKGAVTAYDLTEILGIARRTAAKYLDMIIALDGWTKAAATDRSSRGGPARKAACLSDSSGT